MMLSISSSSPVKCHNDDHHKDENDYNSNKENGKSSPHGCSIVFNTLFNIMILLITYRFEKITLE